MKQSVLLRWIEAAESARFCLLADENPKRTTFTTRTTSAPPFDLWVRPPGVSLALPDRGRPIDIVSGRLRRAGWQLEENARELPRSRRQLITRRQLISCAVIGFGQQLRERAARSSSLRWRVMQSPPRAGRREW
jgi:hypothetical protein